MNSINITYIFDILLFFMGLIYFFSSISARKFILFIFHIMLVLNIILGISKWKASKEVYWLSYVHVLIILNYIL